MRFARNPLEVCNTIRLLSVCLIFHKAKAELTQSWQSANVMSQRASMPFSAQFRVNTSEPSSNMGTIPVYTQDYRMNLLDYAINFTTVSRTMIQFVVRQCYIDISRANASPVDTEVIELNVNVRIKEHCCNISRFPRKYEKRGCDVCWVQKYASFPFDGAERKKEKVPGRNSRKNSAGQSVVYRCACPGF